METLNRGKLVIHVSFYISNLNESSKCISQQLMQHEYYLIFYGKFKILEHVILSSDLF